MVRKKIIKDKTKSGKPRETSLCTILINKLKEYKEWQLQNKKVLGKEYFNSDYVLVRPDGKPYAVKWVNRIGISGKVSFPTHTLP